MRRFAYFLVLLFAVAVAFNFLASPSQVSAQAGGGYVYGYVYSFDQWDQLITVGWADIVATNDVYTFTAYSGGDGFYEIVLPSGTYTLSISEPGYKEYSTSVAVSNGSSTPFNVYLERSQVPIPEFSDYLAAVAIVVAFASVIVLTRRARKATR